MMAGGTATALLLAAGAAAASIGQDGAPAVTAAMMAAGTPQVFEGIPDVRVSHYTVTGRSLAEVRRDMLRRRPVDPNDGTRVDALATVDYRWQFAQSSGGAACTVRVTRFTTTLAVLLPRLADGVQLSVADQRQWDRFLAAARAHEAIHVGINRDGAAEIAAALGGASCDTANAAGQAAIARVVARNVELDRRTRHGQAPGARL